MKRRDLLMAAATSGAAALLSFHPEQGGGGPSEELFAASRHASSERRLSFDRGGRIYQIDPLNHRLLRLEGDTIVWERNQLGRGPGELNFPSAIAFDERGSIYVADTGNRRVQVFSREGELRAVWASDFAAPRGILVDRDRLLVADAARHRVVLLGLDGSPRGDIGEPGLGVGALNAPTAVVAGARGELHVLDSGNVRVQVFNSRGRHLRSYGGFGGQRGQLRSAAAIAFGGGVAYVADPALGVVHVFDDDGRWVRRFAPAGAPVGLTWSKPGELFITTVPAAPTARRV